MAITHNSSTVDVVTFNTQAVDALTYNGNIISFPRTVTFSRGSASITDGTTRTDTFNIGGVTYASIVVNGNFVLTRRAGGHHNHRFTFEVVYADGTDTDVFGGGIWNGGWGYEYPGTYPVTNRTANLLNKPVTQLRVRNTASQNETSSFNFTVELRV